MAYRFVNVSAASAWGFSSCEDEFKPSCEGVQNTAPVSFAGVGDGMPVVRFRTMQKAWNPYTVVPTQWGVDRWDTHVRCYREASGQPFAFPMRQRIFGNWCVPYFYTFAMLVYTVLPLYLARIVSFVSSTFLPSMLGYGHGSLTWYVYTCWAKEMSVLLRPDMLWYTITSEVAREVRLNPDAYRHLFATSDEREDLYTTTDKFDDICMNAVDVTLSGAVADKELKDIVAQTRFAHESEGYQEVIKSVFANMSSPYFNHVSTKCGIPEVGVQGTNTDWTVLAEACCRLAEKFPGGLRVYLKHCSDLVLTIRDNAFCAFTTEEERVRSEVFFSNILWCSNVCGSGTSYTVRGWLPAFCYRTTQAEASFRPEYDTGDWHPVDAPAIDSFPAHLSCFAWVNAETSREYCKVTGLFYSARGKHNFLVPHYAQSTFHVTSDDAFARLKA